MRKALLSLLALVGGASIASAQQMPQGYPTYYPGQVYPQQPMPAYTPTSAPRMYYANGTYGYSQGGAQQPTPYYYNYPNSYYYPTTPQYYYSPQSTFAPQYVYTPASRQMYGMAAPASRSTTSSWPMPASKATTTGVLPDQVETPDGEQLLNKKPVVEFHRPTKDLFWVDAGYTAAFFRPMQLSSPLVTTGSQNDAAPGAIGQPSTAVLYGNQAVNFNLFSGMKLEAGIWLDNEDRFSLELNGFWYFPNYSDFTAASDGGGNPVIARPIFNTSTGTNGAFLTSLPGTLAGSIHIDTKSEIFGTEFNARAHGYFGENWHVDGLFGFRYLRLAERMGFTETVDPLIGGFASFQGNTIGAGSALHDFDQFQTFNQFFGPQVGIRGSYEYKWFTLEGFMKLAIGGTIEQTNISGATTLNSPTGNVTAPGGILALPSNIGSYSRTVLGIVPEFGLNLGVDLCQNVRLKLGYSFLMWNHVVRPGNQINTNVNPGQVPGSPAAVFANVAGPVSPTYRFNEEFFWGHTFNLGVEFHY